MALRLLRWDGSPLSTRRLGDFSGSSQETRCSNVDASGRINVVVHENFQEAPHQSAQFRFAADGSLLAEQRQPAPDYDTRCALDATANTYYVDGPSGVTKRDAAGNVLWEKRFEAPPELGETTWATPHSSSSGLVLQFASSPPGNTALVRVLEDGRVAWTRIVRGALSEYILRVVIAADGLVTVWGASESAVSADGSSTVLPLPAGSSQLPFLLRLRDDGSVASLRVFPDPMRNGRITLGPDGSLYVVSDGADTPSTPAAFYKFDVSGNLVFKRDLGPLLAGWTGTRQFYSVGLSARADRVVLAARTLNTSGFLAQFTP